MLRHKTQMIKTKVDNNNGYLIGSVANFCSQLHIALNVV